MNTKSPIRVGVLRGGPSSQYDVSLRTGDHVLRNLSSQYIGVDILIDKAGIWHVDGIPKNPERILPHVDVVFNALHGHFGEDGKVQSILSALGTPHTSSPVTSSVFALHKPTAKKIFATYGIKTPISVTLSKEQATADTIREMYNSLPHPAIVKPASAGSSLGVHVVHTMSELTDALEAAFAFGEKVIVEEYIAGREATCGVISHFRDQKLYTLPVTEIRRPAGHEHYSFEHKHSADPDAVLKKQIGESIQFDHLGLSPLERAEALRVAQLAHRALGMSHYSRSDMIAHPKRGIFLLETNSQPSLASHSSFLYGLESVGATLEQFLDHVLMQALIV